MTKPLCPARLSEPGATYDCDMTTGHDGDHLAHLGDGSVVGWHNHQPVTDRDEYARVVEEVTAEKLAAVGYTAATLPTADPQTARRSRRLILRRLIDRTLNGKTLTPDEAQALALYVQAEQTDTDYGRHAERLHKAREQRNEARQHLAAMLRVAQQYGNRTEYPGNWRTLTLDLFADLEACVPEAARATLADVRPAPAAAVSALSLRQQLAEARAEAEQHKGEYLGACKTIADMHAAALGEVRGPIRGVVEDVADLRAHADAASEALTNALDNAAALREQLTEANRTFDAADSLRYALGSAPVVRLRTDQVTRADKAEREAHAARQGETEAVRARKAAENRAREAAATLRTTEDQLAGARAVAETNRTEAEGLRGRLTVALGMTADLDWVTLIDIARSDHAALAEAQREMAKPAFAPLTVPVSPREMPTRAPDDHPVHELRRALLGHRARTEDQARGLISSYYDAITSGPPADPAERPVSVSVGGTLTREQVQDALRDLARTDQVWFKAQLAEYGRRQPARFPVSLHGIS